MDHVKLRIPAGLSFPDLRLSRDPVTGSVKFDLATVDKISAASGIDLMQQPEDAVAGVIVEWYIRHRADGGASDPIAEQLIAEVEAEDFGDVQRGPTGTQ